MRTKSDYKSRWKKAKRTERLARTFTRYALTKEGYHSVSLESKKGFESTGVVDVVAVKKIFKENPDKMEIVLLQRKGNLKVTEEELERLRRATEMVIIKYGIAEYKEGRMAKVKIFDSQQETAY